MPDNPSFGPDWMYFGIEDLQAGGTPGGEFMSSEFLEEMGWSNPDWRETSLNNWREMNWLRQYELNLLANDFDYNMERFGLPPVQSLGELREAAEHHEDLFGFEEFDPGFGEGGGVQAPELTPLGSMMFHSNHPDLAFQGHEYRPQYMPSTYTNEDLWMNIFDLENLD